MSIAYKCDRCGSYFDDANHQYQRSYFDIYKARFFYKKEWTGLGFYDYGVTLDLGWFEPDKLPERYRVLLEPEVVALDTKYFGVDEYVMGD